MKLDSKTVFVLVLVGTTLLSGALIMRFHLLPKMRELQASSWARNLELAAAAYAGDHAGQWPPSEPRALVRTLRGADSGGPVGDAPAGDNYLARFPVRTAGGLPVDPWKQPMLVEEEAGRLRVTSPGPDGRPGTGDDIDRSVADTEAAKIEAKSPRDS